MNENKKEFHYNFGGKTITIETGRLAKQADGAVLISCEGTQLLATVVSSKTASEEQDFFPLMVDYKEKFYAAGKFLGGFMKRESRPSNAEILMMRMVDRPFRPLFPEGYNFETVIQLAVHSYDPKADPEVLAGIGAAAALTISDIPFNGPAGFCKVARINGQFVLNPSVEEWEKSDLEMAVAGSKEAILMTEGEAKELPEEVMADAIMWAHKHIQGLCEFLEQIQREVGKPKRAFTPILPNQKLMAKLQSDFTNDAKECLKIHHKLSRQDAIANMEEKIISIIKEKPEDFGLTAEDNIGKKTHAAVDELMYKIMRKDILDNHRRIGDRKLNQVRPIETEVNVLKKVHGSSLFTRGETQVLSAVTIGGKDGEQMVDAIAGISYLRFYLHYTFAPYCVGEARGYKGVGRREVGHGNLAERALKGALPSEKEFPYTIRVACEVTESNGSSSMGSVCSGSMALMDAGVPLRAPVAGVAMGLIKENDDVNSKFVILTDILGDEDHLGDMDFKVAGTANGVTAIQMDIKIKGITREILDQALKQAHEGRMHILGEMSKTTSSHRKELKDGVPRIGTVKIAPDKIGALIGPSGKNIKGLQEEFKVTIEVDEEGMVKVISSDTKSIESTINIIDLQLNGPELGAEYEAEVVSIKEYGAFVDIASNVSGLLHVSEIAVERVNNVEDYVSIGDRIKVKVVEIDRFGKIKLSAKAIAPLTNRKNPKK
ncbi:MAG: polyribonucleotide nucleotidyltransferase [Oligoflexia bacterium]|nr:polyribonucleotide nucleotidyltransferase [Oligoflexia bacterium]